MAGEFDDIRRRLEAISEELGDLAIDRLRESIDAGGNELPVDERRLTRARRAGEKAAAALAEPGGRGEGPGARDRPRPPPGLPPPAPALSPLRARPSPTL